MIGREIHSGDIEEEMIKWSKDYSTTLVLTRGSDGVSYVEDNKVYTVDVQKVKVKDTTGAGDTFNGILTSLLAKKFSLADAIRFVNYGAALSTTKVGAQSAMSTDEELSRFIANIEK